MQMFRTLNFSKSMLVAHNFNLPDCRSARRTLICDLLLGWHQVGARTSDW